MSPDGLFNPYNFTVTEAPPLDTEVGVDPEMLGKLFEETVNARHSSGAYYTPRPVVSFMCRAALKGYLAGRNIPNLAADKEEIAPPEYKQFLLKAYAAAAMGRSEPVLLLLRPRPATAERRQDTPIRLLQQLAG